jgi:hypothetical protein
VVSASLVVALAAGCSSDSANVGESRLHYCLTVNTLIGQFDELEAHAPAIVTTTLVTRTNNYVAQFHHLGTSTGGTADVRGLVVSIAEGAQSFAGTLHPGSPFDTGAERRAQTALVSEFRRLQHSCFGSLPTPIPT